MPVENFNFFTAFCYFRIASICQVVAAASFLSHLFFLSSSPRVASFFFRRAGPARARRGDDGTAAPLTPPCRRRRAPLLASLEGRLQARARRQREQRARASDGEGCADRGEPRPRPRARAAAAAVRRRRRQRAVDAAVFVRRGAARLRMRSHGFRPNTPRGKSICVDPTQRRHLSQLITRRLISDLSGVWRGLIWNPPPPGLSRVADLLQPNWNGFSERLAGTALGVGGSVVFKSHMARHHATTKAGLIFTSFIPLGR